MLFGLLPVFFFPRQSLLPTSFLFFFNARLWIKNWQGERIRKRRKLRRRRKGEEKAWRFAKPVLFKT